MALDDVIHMGVAAISSAAIGLGVWAVRSIYELEKLVAVLTTKVSANDAQVQMFHAQNKESLEKLTSQTDKLDVKIDRLGEKLDDMKTWLRMKSRPP